MHEPNVSLAPAALLNEKYRIVREIGKGGMGRVYEAIHVEIGRRVAIKHLRLEFSIHQEFVKRFRMEAKLAASIRHDNICEVNDVGVATDGSPYLVMPLLEGCPLADLIEEDEKISLPRLIDIICQALSALETAHKAGIVHRDMKPDNIFITRYGDREDFVKILDFGVSKVINEVMGEQTLTNLTQTGATVGTPYYMAPEQVRGQKDIDGRLDVYAVGVILYEALTGWVPFDGDNINNIIFKILDDPLVAPSDIAPDIPPSLERIVLRAMSREPQERFSSAWEMREALLKFQSGELAEPPVVVKASKKITPSGSLSSLTSPVSGQDPALSETDFDPDSTLLQTITRKNVSVAVLTTAVVLIALALFFYFVWGGEPKAAQDLIPSKTTLEPAKTTTAKPTRVQDPEAKEAPKQPETTAPAIQPSHGSAERRPKRESNPRPTPSTADSVDDGKYVNGRFRSHVMKDYDAR